MNKEIRNILMFGRTGSGKSTLANVLTGTNNFKESASSVSETKDYQIETFDVNQDNGKTITYRIIDTIGIGDTGLSPETVLYKIGMVAKEVKEHGINRVFFVTDGRFKEEEAKAFQVLSEVIFDEKVFKHTTIARTNFTGFRDADKRDDDVQNLMGVNQVSFPIISKIVETDRNNIVHVSNPPLIGSEEEMVVAQKNREFSRNILLKHLTNRETIYRPENIDEINKGIEDHINKEKEERERLEKTIKELKEKLEKIKENKEEIAKAKAEAKAEVERIKTEKEKIKAEAEAKIVEAESKAKEEAEKIKAEAKAKIAKAEKEIAEAEANAKAKIAEAEAKAKAVKEEREKMEKEKVDLQKSIEEVRAETKNLIAQEMAKHIEKKLNLTDVMKAGREMVAEGATTGVELGAKAFPIPGIGSTGGGLIGVGIGTAGAFTAAAIYFVNILLGR